MNLLPRTVQCPCADPAAGVSPGGDRIDGLATAQIQPHFLFDTLASLQHWVQSGDTRAAPLLADLTAFLRATLPLFNRQRKRLGDEAEAVRRYLAVMQLRLGERLRYSVQVDAAAAELQARISVRDTGPGCAPGAPQPTN